MLMYRRAQPALPLLVFAVALTFLLTFAAASRRNPVLHLPGVHLLRAGRLVVEIPQIKECDGADNAVRFSNMRMGMVGKVDFVIDADFNVSRSSSALKEVQVELTKCQEAVSSNTCEYYQTWRFKDHLCSEWNDPDKPWGAALASIEPRPECPIKQGSYRIRNGTIDLKVLQALPIPLEGSIWLVRTSLKEDAHTVHTCTELTMEPHRVRD